MQMTQAALLAGLVYGLTVALLSLGIFYVIGLLVVPSRWHESLRWPDSVALGLTFYVVLCWIAISARHIPLKYMPFVLAALSIPAWSWLRPLHETLVTRFRSREARWWLRDFGALYLIAYLLVPSAGPKFLPLGSGENVLLVTYARYARQLFEFGTSSLDRAPFDYLLSPASMFLLAWQSLAFGRDPLQAAMPTLLALAALFGMVAAETGRVVFGLTRRASMAIACFTLCTPVFRWILGTFGIAELLAATAMLYVLRTIVNATIARSAFAPAGICILMAGALLALAAPPWAGWGRQIASGIPALLSAVSFGSLFGLPGTMPVSTELSIQARSAAVVVLALSPVVYAAVAWAAFGLRAFELPGITAIDRRLAQALAVYAVLSLALGNVVVHAMRVTRPARRPAEWRQLDQVNALAFRNVTLKVADDAHGLSAALAMYYLPGRKAEVFGRDISPEDLSFDSVSREQPMFVQNFGCEGVGHGDTVSVQAVGCLLMAPPSMALGTSYPFNQTFLFLTYDHMTPRQAGGRWNTRPTLQLQVKSDPQRVPLDRDLFINLLLHPMTPDGTKPRPLVFRWGSDHRGDVSLGEQRWLSMPVRSGDWTGTRLWMLPLTIEFLDGRAVLFNELALTEQPRGAVVGQ
jgi:hypothetical protein